MGTQNSIPFIQDRFPKQFRELREMPGVYRNIVDGSKLQRHLIDIDDKQDIKYEKQIFMFRKMNENRLISCRYFQKIEPSQFCGTLNKICYFTELPEYNFSKNLKIPLDHGINLIIQCLEGFQILYKKFGGFEVCEDQIFLDSKGKLKVWVDANLGKSKPNSSCTQKKVVEQYMICQIFKIFDHVQDEKKIPCQYTSYLRKFEAQQRQLLSFNKVIKYMADIQSRYFSSRVKNIHKTSKQQMNYNNKNFKLKKATQNSNRQRIRLARRSQDDQYTYKKDQSKFQNNNSILPTNKTGFLASTANQSTGKVFFIKNQTIVSENESQALKNRSQKMKKIQQTRRMIRKSADDCYTENITMLRQAKCKIKISANYFDLAEQPKNESTKNNSGMGSINKCCDKQKRISIANRAKDNDIVYLNYGSPNQFMKQMKTAKSIMQHTDLNIDSTILMDLQNFQREISVMDQGSSNV